MGMEAYALKVLSEAVVAAMSEENIKEFADMCLDFVENKVISSVNKVDDKLVLPACAIVRRVFDIPDEDE